MWFEADYPPQMTYSDLWLDDPGFSLAQALASEAWSGGRNGEVARETFPEDFSAGLDPAISGEPTDYGLRWSVAAPLDGGEESWADAFGLGAFETGGTDGNSKGPDRTDPNSDADGDGVPDEDITVTGSRLRNSGFISGGGGGGDGPGYGSEGGGGGGYAGDQTPGDDLDHPQTCTTQAGAADQIRDHIVSTGTDASELTRSSSDVEYGAFIVALPGGQFGAANSMIYTDGLESQVHLNDNVPNNLSSVVGVIHNHTGFGTQDLSLIAFYGHPGLDDWDTLDILVSQGVPPAQLSLWIVDPRGTLHEFKYTDKTYWASLTEDQKKNPETLPEASSVQGCGSGS